MSRQSRIALLMLIVGVLLIGTGLRVHDLGVHSLGSAELGAAANKPPLYSQIVDMWRIVAGSSEFSLRFLSVLLGIVTVSTAYAIGKSLFDPTIGMLGALFVALMPYQVWHSRLAEPSGLFVALAALSIWITIKVLNLPGRMIARRFNRREAGVIAALFVISNTLGLIADRSFGLITLAETIVFGMWLARRVINARSQSDSRLSPVQTLMHGLRVWVVLNLIPIITLIALLVSAQPIDAPQAATALVPFAAKLAYGETVPLDAARGGMIPLALLALVGLFPPIDEEAEARRYLRFSERAGLLVAVIAVILIGAALGWNLSLLPANLCLGLLAARGLAFGYDLGTPMPGTGGLNTFFIRLTMVALAIFAATPMFSGLGTLYGNGSMQLRARAAFGDPPLISLDGYSLSATSLQPGDTLDVTLYWHADATPDARLKVFVHLYSADGTLLVQHDSEPVDFTRPTNTWVPSETVHDTHRIEIPEDAASGGYTIAVGVYPIDGGARLPVMENGSYIGDLLTLQEIEIR